MPIFDLYVAAMIIIMLASLWAGWRVALAGPTVHVAPTSARLVSWGFLLVYLLWKPMFYDWREDIDDLVNAGLSTSNRIEVLFTALSAGWMLWLLISRSLPFGHLLRGPGFWITALILSLLASVLWSLWPQLSLYKGIELLAFWIITAHVAASPLWRLDVERIAVVALVAGWWPYVFRGMADFSGGVVGAFYNNEGAMVAGIVLLVGAQRFVLLRDIRSGVLLATSLLSLVLFHSFTTDMCVALSLLLLGLLMLLENAGRTALIVVLTGTVAAGGAAGWLLTHVDEALMRGIAGAFGKGADELSSLTGRLPLWQALWDASKNSPFGTGFFALERTIFSVADPDSVGWEAAHSHNGFLSAWLGSGYLGLGLIVMFCMALATQIMRLDHESRLLLIPLTVFLVLNNFSYPVFGGRLNPGWLIIMTLAFAAPFRPSVMALTGAVDAYCRPAVAGRPTI